MLVIHSRILSYFCFTPLFLLVSIALTVTHPFSAGLFDFSVGRINSGTLSAALTSRWSGHSGSSIELACSMPDSTSVTQLSSLAIGLCRWQFQLSQFSESKMFSGVLSSSLSTSWLFILLIWRTLNIWVRPPGRSFADKAGGKGDPSHNLNAATPSCWKNDLDALMISSISEMYPMAAICLFWTQDSFRVARKYWLHRHIWKRLWILAILCNFHSSVSFFFSKSFSVFVVSNAGL